LQHVEVAVPASSANLGPGFDSLGLALQLYNRVRMELTDGPTTVMVSGEGAGALESGADNLVYRSVRRLYEELALEAPALRITMENEIPVSRGLGSSSSAIVAGLVGANTLLAEPLGSEDLLRLAVEIEGHPDNVAPALLGGLQVTAATDTGLVHLTLPVPADLRAVVCIPAVALSTEAARAALPHTYSRADAVFNLGRAALLVAALSGGHYEALGAAMEDRIHQPYRASLVPGFAEALQAAREAGAVGACLSGSGSTMLALATANEVAIGEAMVAEVRRAGADGRWLALDVDRAGARVL
jgi:homoserine kinase